jgi:hypothetical protein
LSAEPSRYSIARKALPFSSPTPWWYRCWGGSAQTPIELRVENGPELTDLWQRHQGEISALQRGEVQAQVFRLIHHAHSTPALFFEDLVVRNVFGLEETQGQPFVGHLSWCAENKSMKVT